MAHADHDHSASLEDGERRALDASFKVDTSSLAGDDLDFARMMGFGEDASTGAETHEDDGDAAPRDTGPAPSPPPLEAVSAAVDEGEAHAAASAGNETGNDTEDEDADDAPAATDLAPRRSDPDAADPRDEEREARRWEEIAPRPAADGIQSTLTARADEILRQASLSPATGPDAIVGPTPDLEERAALQQALDRERARCATLTEELASCEEALADLRARALQADVSGSTAASAGAAEAEKLVEQLRSELDAMGLERDQLVDRLAATSGRLVQSEGRVEQLQASLKTARGALTPLPEGERALRAEVIGLRGRLEQTLEEQTRLTSRLAALETDLAIARARVEDRQHEIDHHTERARELEATLAARDAELAAARAQHRESVALVARVQAENHELRSTQAALEETLSARDLEITAREEHLAVVRRGLAMRDAQLIDLREELDQAHRRAEALEADRQRDRLEVDQLVARVERREARIATLTETLDRIEQAMGRAATGSARSGSTGRESRSDEQPETASEAGPDRPDPGARPATQAPAAGAVLASPVSLPAILPLWRDRRLDELGGGGGTGSLPAFLARQLHDRLGSVGRTGLRIRSLGGSLPEAEVRLVEALRALGHDSVRIEVLDGDPARADARRRRVELAGLGDVIEIVEGDLDDWAPDDRCDAWLASDVLDDQPALERILDRFEPSLRAGALLLFVGRIGAGPIQLSASTLSRLEELWSVLPDALIAADGFDVAPEPGDDGGLSPVQPPVAQALLDRFEPLLLAGFGHLVDLVVGPARGFALSPEDPEAVRLVESVDALDASRALSERLPPRHGVGVFGLGAAAEESDRPDRRWPPEESDRAGRPWPPEESDRLGRPWQVEPDAG